MIDRDYDVPALDEVLAFEGGDEMAFEEPEGDKAPEVPAVDTLAPPQSPAKLGDDLQTPTS